MRHILLLGGTAEARQLAERLSTRAGIAVTLALAGRTASPRLPPVAVRVGGFGGIAGLVGYLSAEQVAVLIDATHPYAATMSDHAARAAAAAGIPLLSVRRPPWMPVASDRWSEVPDAAAAVAALGQGSRRVFLALGRQELAPFARAPQHHYLVRSIEPVEPPLAVPHATYITGRGPFGEADDRRLLETHAIDVVVAKNSGGTATYGKIAAARALGLPVIMLRRPKLPDGPFVESVDAAIAWLDHALAPKTARGV